ncbi:class I SAM-dependent methyltransferase [Streptomyces sp. NPDC048290]|uniref:class I SAM-dependent methyltransferase n=1 Tax=Streptomyces sp. NPDC048290 TaxID=3155811 RepID=UPI003437470A
MTAPHGVTHPETSAPAAPVPPPPRRLDDVKGWFPVLDQLLFAWLLDRQRGTGLRGDLLEIGVFLGKSAIFLGRHRQDGEAYTVCDLFEGDAPDGANRAEATKSYAALTRHAFETNYLAFHDELPHILQGPSSVVPGEVPPASCRFVHIDGSHLYEHVRGDIGAAREALVPDGIVVLDDFRSEHTPGVSVAAWEAVLSHGLRPVCLTTQKLYGTWGDPAPVQEELLSMVRGRDDCELSVQHAAGHRLVRLKSRRSMTAPAFPPSRYAGQEPVQGRDAEGQNTDVRVADRLPQQRRPAPPPHRPRSRALRLVHALLPQPVIRALRKTRTPAGKR